MATKTNTKTLIWFYVRVLRVVGLQKPITLMARKTKSVPDWFDSYVETEDKRQEELQKEQEQNVMTMEEMEAIFAKKKIEKAKERKGI